MDQTQAFNSTTLVRRDSSSIKEGPLPVLLTDYGERATSFPQLNCSGQPIPDSGLSFSSATAGGSPSLN
ncbi:hypothetical protein BKN47_17865 [Pseudomonas aeruginosa]|nr:hypothetical protein BKN47_17865 [Pseudomonas aeruginosa]